MTRALTTRSASVQIRRAVLVPSASMFSDTAAVMAHRRTDNRLASRFVTTSSGWSQHVVQLRCHIVLISIRGDRRTGSRPLLA